MDKITCLASPVGDGNRQGWVDRLRHPIAGITAGGVTTLLLHPLDLVKVRLQVSDGQALRMAHYRGTLGSLRTIVNMESFSGLYQGISPAITGSAVAWGFYFFCYEHAKQRYLEQSRANGHSNATLSSWHHGAAALEGGVLTVLLTNPIWLVKTRMQLQVTKLEQRGAVSKSSQRYPSMWGSFKWILRNEGFTGLYRGLGPALFLTSHGVVQFSVYEKLKSWGEPYGNNPMLFFTFGALSKLMAAAVTYPAQVIKSRLMQDAEVTGATAYTTVFASISRMWRNEGVRGFYKGMAPYLYRGVLSSAVTLGVYEQVSRALQVDRE